jgi:hypothetical protein
VIHLSNQRKKSNDFNIANQMRNKKSYNSQKDQKDLSYWQNQNSERLASFALNSSFKLNNEISNKYLRMEALRK